MIYLDHAAAAPLDPRVLESMRPYLMELYGNPSSFHSVGLRSKEAIVASRKTVARLLNAHEEEIIFTSGGTEANNLALLGLVSSLSQRNVRTNDGTLGGVVRLPHVITSAIEHHSVLEPLQHLEKNGALALTILPVDRTGRVSASDVTAALRSETVLISIMTANNEIGTLEPIADIGRALLAWRKENKTAYPYFHTDACQATPYLDLNVEKTHVDLLTLNGSKMYGPKGVGALFVRRGVRLEPLIRGGGQERNLRSGTENVPGIVGLAAAFELVQTARESESARLIPLRERLIEGLSQIPKTRLNGHPLERLPNNASLSFLDIEGEAAVLYLDAEGIMASTGSACASSSLAASHVILAIGLAYEAAHGSLRFTLGRSTTEEEIERVIEVMPAIIERLRKMSPVNLDMKYFK